MIALHAAVLDDDPLDIEALRIHLDRIGAFEVRLDTYADAVVASRAILAQPVDVLFLDRRLNDVDGMDVLRDLRAAGYADPIVVLTGSDPPTASELIRLHATEFLLKQSLTPVLLANAVRHCLEVRTASRELQATLAELRTANEAFATVLRALPVGVVLVDADGKVSLVNDGAAALLRVAAGECAGRGALDLFVGAERAALAVLKLQAAAVADRREPTTLRLPCADGSQVWVDVAIVDDPRDRRRRLWCLTDATDLHVLRDQLDSRSRRDGLVGQSEAMLELRRRIADLCRVDATVLIEGETGTGKELVARALHNGSGRASKPFVAVNCGGLSETLIASQLFGHRRGSFTGAVADHKGFFETANGGTIFLDEIGDVPPPVQVALLRVLQEREVMRVGDSVPRKVDVRVVAATNRNLQDLVDKGQFRLDLLFRLRVARLALPPLRNRAGDIALLATAFLRDLRATGATKVESVSGEALRHMARYPWPGNVRELRAALEYATIHCRRSEIHTADLPPELLAAPAGPADVEDKLTAAAVRDAVRRAGGNRSRAAELLGISRATLYRRLGELGL